jgi:hypothetical protein
LSIEKLILNITPLYNKYKQNKKVLKPIESLGIMWEIGNLLYIYIKDTKIAPHNLYRSIYGKSEGTKNIIQKSYITREFQGRCYRIRKIFVAKDEIRKLLPNLNSVTAFREAMPFFDNYKYKLKGEARENLLILLNSNLETKSILNQINSLQKNFIGKKNPRTQRLKDIQSEKNAFINFYNYIYRLTNSSNNDIIAEIKRVGEEDVVNLAKNTTSLTEEGLKFYPITKHQIPHSPWLEYKNVIELLINQKNAVLRRRFRRLIPPERIAFLAEMLYKLLNENEKVNKNKNYRL